MAQGKGLDDIDAADIESTCNETTDSFEAMNLKTDLLRAIYACGFERPSAFQQHAITPVIKGNDVIAQTQSGTGKTAAFTIPVIQKIDPNLKACQAIILAASRERVQQIQKAIVTIGNFTNLECYACVGGKSIKDTIEALQEKLPLIIVGTPGRVHDMILQHRVLCTDNIRVFVLDEADVIFSRGFTEQIHDVFPLLPPKTSTQVVLFFANMSQDVLDFTTKFMRDPVRITVEKYEICLKGIKQFYITVKNEHEDWKVDSLSTIYKIMSNRRAVVFCNTKGQVEWLADKLTARDCAVLAIHGNMDAVPRDLIMMEFRSGSRVLIATDLIARRNLDVQQIPLIINYDLPANPEDYIHRVGHGGHGRCGRKSVAINLVATADVRTMHEIEQFYSTRIEEMPVNIADIL